MAHFFTVAEPSDPSIFVEPITEERASRTLYRVELLRKVREQVLRSPQLNERLKLCRPSLYLPVWWECGKHDRDLLIGTAKHGLSRTDYYILNDPQLSFREAHRNYVQNGSSYFQNVPAPYSQSSLNLSQSASPASTVLTLGEKDNIEQMDTEQEKIEEALEEPSPKAGALGACLEVKNEEDAADCTSRCDASQAKVRPPDPVSARNEWGAANCIQAGFFSVPNSHIESKGTSEFGGNCNEDNGGDSLQSPILKCSSSMENLQAVCGDANQTRINCLNFVQVKSNGVLELQTVSEKMADRVVAPVCSIAGAEPVMDTVLGVIAKHDLKQCELLKAENGCSEDKQSTEIIDRENVMIEHTYDMPAKYLAVGHVQTAANGIDKSQAEINQLSDPNSPAATPKDSEVSDDLKLMEAMSGCEQQAVAVSEISSTKEAGNMTNVHTESDHAPFEAI
eukprot:g46097.t1